MHELITWFHAVLDAEERQIGDSDPNGLGLDYCDTALGIHLDPEWAHAEVDAKRRILKAWENANEIAKEPNSDLVVATRHGLEIAIRALAFVSAGCEGYREEWRP